MKKTGFYIIKDKFFEDMSDRTLRKTKKNIQAKELKKYLQIMYRDGILRIE